MAKANIYLILKNDRKAYIDCFLALVRDQPNSTSFKMLGDAYMKIQLPEKASESFLEAFSKGSENLDLCKQVGHALWSCHKYQKAKNFYKNFLAKQHSGKEIRKELIKICVKLNDYDESLEMLKQMLRENDKNASKLQSSKTRIDNFILMAQVYKSIGQHDREKNAWIEARSEIKNILADKSSFNKHDLLNNVETLVLILHNIAAILEKECDYVAAKKLYNEVLAQVPNDKVSLISLTRISLIQNNLKECQSNCDDLQRKLESDNDINICLTEVFTAQSRRNEAIDIFQKTLKENPNNYLMLSKYITVLWRSNRLDEIDILLDSAKLNLARSLLHGGFYYSKGLYFRYKKSYEAALECFNRASIEKQWREDSIVNMIQIYLNLDNQEFWVKTEKPLIHKSHMRSVNVLLERLSETSKDTQMVKLLRAYYVLLSNSAANSASREFNSILEKNSGYIPALFGLAMSYVIDRYIKKARNVLKKIATVKYDWNYWDVFEKSYVMLAESYIKNKNFELSKELCERSILINRTNSKAWKLLAIIHDEKKNHDEATRCYEKCWELNKKKESSTGYNLSTHFIRQGKIGNAMEVQALLAKNSSNGLKIKNIIINKCVESLRG